MTVSSHCSTKRLETDEGYVTLVNAKEENGKLTETPERTGLWAWKHTHQADGSVDYKKLEGDVVFDDVDFGYVPEKIVLHDVDLLQHPVRRLPLSAPPELERLPSLTLSTASTI